MNLGEMSPGPPPGSGRFLTRSITLFLHNSCILFILFNLITCQFIEIQTELGRVRGVRIQSQMNNPAIAFLGIPYALPPTGERRFKVSFCFYYFLLSTPICDLIYSLYRDPFPIRNGHRKRWSPQTTNPAARSWTWTAFLMVQKTVSTWTFFSHCTTLIRYSYSYSYAEVYPSFPKNEGSTVLRMNWPLKKITRLFWLCLRMHTTTAHCHASPQTILLSLSSFLIL